MGRTDMFELIDKTELTRLNDEIYTNYYMYEEYMGKTSEYRKEEWQRVLSSGEIILKDIASKMDCDPSDRQVQECVSEFKRHVSDNFYLCNSDTFKALGERYVNDESLGAKIDKIKPGLSKFLGKAILMSEI